MPSESGVSALAIWNVILHGGIWRVMREKEMFLTFVCWLFLHMQCRDLYFNRCANFHENLNVSKSEQSKSKRISPAN